MIVLVAECGGKKNRDRVRPHGWGRMWATDRVRRDWGADEPWGLDNGAYSCWVNGREFDGDLFMRRLGHAYGIEPEPCVAVVPDLVARGLESLDFSLSWMDRLPDWPWFLAVQDGMTPDDVRPHLHNFRGLFLGGSDRFKATGPQWCNMAHSNGLRFHYGRCGQVSRVRDAIEMGADSIDSSTPLQRPAAFEVFAAAVTGTHPQPQMFSGLSA